MITYHVKSLNQIANMFKEKSREYRENTIKYSKTQKEKDKYIAISAAWQSAADILENTIIDSENE